MAELEFQALSVRIRERTLLDALTLSVERGDFLALIGPNGAGKTTLIKTALGLLMPSAGRVRLLGRGLATFAARERAAAIAWLPQHMRADEPVTALESVAAARFRFRESHARSVQAARQALARVGADGYAARPMTQLSGGERQRVAFACLIAQEAQILLFDEPANHLDPAQQLEVYRLLGELWREGHTIICINHDVNLLQRVGNPSQLRVLGLDAGRLVFEAPLSAPSLPGQLGALFGLEMDTIESHGQRLLVPRLKGLP